MSETDQVQPEQTPQDTLLDVALVDQVPAEAMWEEYTSRRKRRRWWLYGEREEPPVSVLGPVAEPDPNDDRFGICCSGGGIRSASFNLGALQAIQDKKRLQKTRFLSAVSGGSYIAAAFAIVAKTSRPGDPRDPAGMDSDPELVTPDSPPFERWSPEEQYLRNRASYMAPTGADKAYLVWRILLGLLINLLLIGAVVALLAAALSLYYRSAHPGLIRPPHAPLGASPSGTVVLVGGLIMVAGILLGIASVMVRKEQHADRRRFLELWSLRVFCFGLVVLVLEAVVPELIDLLRKDSVSGGTQKAGGVDEGSLGAVASGSVAAILAAIVAQLRSATADPVKVAREATGFITKLGPRLRMALIYLAAWVLGPLLILAMLVVATLVQVETRDTLVRAAIPVGAFVVALGFMRYGDLNTWSLHPFYRRRLSTAFALRRVWREGDPPGGRAEACPERELLLMSKTHVLPQIPAWEGRWPTLLVCAAANVSDPGAAPPGRGVTTFTFSAAEMGGPLVGGVVTEYFEQRLPETRRRDFTLPAAVAMSGAAVSPSMGKMTRPSVRFLMAMANVRLGVWVPNPRRLESFVGLRSELRKDASGIRPKLNALLRPGTFERVERSRAVTRASARRTTSASVPRPSPLYLLKELLGWNSINDKFLYVTDGGHYENLGLIELLRRGCRHIYCFDASGGRQLAQLGDAIALARSELGVEISFPDGQLERLMENEKGVAKARCAAGTLTYMHCHPHVTGKIVYVPTVFTGNLPWDVRALKEEDNRFPHHSTMDQLFTDQKFEAYRTLGYCGAVDAMTAMDGPLAEADAEADGGDARPGFYELLERLLSPRPAG
jgi:hypothetical protein